MIPRADVQLDPEIPDGYEFWTPKRDDISEEGFGYFRDTWLIRGVGVRAARSLMKVERDLVAVADHCSSTLQEFDDIATALESGDLDEVPESVAASAPFERVAQYYSPGERMSPVEGLDVGVAGLVCALAAVRCWPAASCRGHGPSGWAPHPMVYLAADRHRATTLGRLVAATGCGFGMDPARDQLLVVMAPSVLEIMELASLVLDARHQFPKRRGSRTRHDDSTQIPFEWTAPE